ncbi:putative baseplate assembly protein [Altericista sp. CCNU0014]|uniref:putative baseplate assembly protein n=1 Tax=Altericista sp. CCNU0014 TaxID=3082949 RepID=UPI003850707A
MEFDFLPKLPKSNLDDRTFQDLVDECVLRIPRYCPEWTNYNPGDPGITLVELFAWLTDQMLVRFNQVPRRNFIVFLEMLGIRLQAATPAHTELTFYLSADLPSTYEIPTGTEVATVRMENEEAIVFSTREPLRIGIPRISHFLTAETADLVPQVLRDRLSNLWSQQPDGSWQGQEQFIFNEHPQPGNCFYFVFEPEQEIAGNVLALKLRGEAATSTGINPDFPPRRWEAWDGLAWQPVLLAESDDGTRGFSFSNTGQNALNRLEEADIVLHLPLQWSAAHFSTYRGRWLRCIYVPPEDTQAGYSRSPQLVGVSVRSIGGTVPADQCTRIQDELLGNSDGTPGQTFQLQSTSILPRNPDEHIIAIPPGGLPEVWQEVSDFADSTAQDRHYTLDSTTGQIQFGPLVREPAELRDRVQWRSRIQTGTHSPLQVADRSIVQQLMEQQYGAVPARGAQIRMTAYRTGGGLKGNVQRGTLRIPKTAVPYVDRVVNHKSALNGADAESLENAVIRIPRILRTRDRAVTPEDFETLTLQAGRGAVARVHCLKPTLSSTPGTVNLLVVPQANTEQIERGEGLDPSQFRLAQPLREQILAYLDERRLLGVQVQLQEPDYVGVFVQAEVGLAPEYSNPQAQQILLSQLQVALYRFLNPLTGGVEGQGWPFGSPVYTSDIVSLLQKMPGVRHLGSVLLFELRQEDGQWQRSLAPGGIVQPSPWGLICSWADRLLRSGHAISLIR